METWSNVAEIQPLASKIMMNSIKKDRISHAYLLQGGRGTGKEALALLLAKTLFCQEKQGVEPCQTCNMCKRIESRNHPDVHWLEPDGRSIKIDQVQHLQKEFTYSGLESNQKVYIVTHADTLTVNAANRILKFLEEPSQQTTAIMLTENIHSIIPTVRSRCQIIDLQPLNTKAFQERLLDLNMTRSNATLISALTNDINEAIAFNEDEWFAQARKVMLQLIDRYVTNSADTILFMHQYWLPHFKDLNQQELGLDLLLHAFKDILYYHIGHLEAMVVFSANEERLEKARLYFSQEKLLVILQLLLKAKRQLKQNVNPTLVMEQLTLHIQR